MAQRHPDNAAYVSADGKVSFDRYGRKLDSIGNVVAGDRQRAGDAGATPYEQPKRESRATPAGENGLMARNVQLPQRFTAGPGAKMTSTAPQRSGWDNSVLPGTASTGASAGTGGVNVLRPARQSLSNYTQFGSERWPATMRWEGGGNPQERQWRTPAQSQQAQPVQQGPSYEFPEYAPSSFDNSMPVPEPTPLGIPQATQPNAFEQASVYWGPGGLPMPNNRRFDPGQEQYSVYPMQKPYQPSYQPQGLPVLNNQQFDPYQP